MSDARFLRWLASRIVRVYGEPDGTDFVLKLKEIAERLEKLDDKLEETKDV